MITIGDITSAIDSLKRRAVDAPLQTAGDIAGGMARSIPVTLADLAGLVAHLTPNVNVGDPGKAMRQMLDDVPALRDQGDIGMKLGEMAGPPAKLLTKVLAAGALPAIKLARDLPHTGELEGLPATSPGAFAPAQQAASNYMAAAGRGYAPPTKYVEVNPARSQEIAAAYDAMPHAPDDPKVKAAYDAMIKETLDQWEQIKKTGLKVDFIDPAKGDPYSKPSDVLRDIQENNHMWVFPTEGGFGGSASSGVDISGNPLLQPAGEINGRPVVANDIFRIVHDYFGHAKNGVGFRANGEENAWRAHASMYSDLARQAMTSETRGQNSWVNFGPFGDFNRTANGAETQYAPQKTGLLPPQYARDQYEAPGALGLGELAQRYPELAPGVLKTDPKSGKQFLSKQLSPEAQTVQAARQAAQKDIEAGNYDPLFPVEERFHADPANYPVPDDTLTAALPKKDATVDKWLAQFDTPEVRQRLSDAYDVGSQDPMARDWYAMGQLEKAFTDTLGPEAGRAAFKQRFADAMAATTGGADPTSNLMMSAYGNFLREAGQPIPKSAIEMPFPIGGRYVTGNMDMYDRVINQGEGLDAATKPKRHNFSANFQGHTDRRTIDEQMMTAFDPSGKMPAPPGDSYGVLEHILNDVLAEKGVPVSENGQDVMWAALKGVQGKPMIQHVNEMIERTARITGKTPKQVLDGFIRGNMPMYSLGGLALGANQLAGQDDAQ